MRVLGVIPARLASTRLPEKPLARLRGRPLVEHVWRRARQASRLERLVVATDSEAVRTVAAAFGAEVLLTAAEHASGSDRVAEVARQLPEYDVLVNVQGDEPLLEPAALDATVEGLLEDAAADATTLAHEEHDAAAGSRAEVVRVERDGAGYATAFHRGVPGHPPPVLPFLRHVGLYAYRRETLLAFSSWAPTPAERAASLEQLRLLDHGLKMRVVVTSYRSQAVDTADDLACLEANWERLSNPAAAAPSSSSQPEYPK